MRHNATPRGWHAHMAGEPSEDDRPPPGPERTSQVSARSREIARDAAHSQVSAVSLLLATAHMLSSDAERLWKGGTRCEGLSPSSTPTRFPPSSSSGLCPWLGLLQGYSPLTYAMVGLGREGGRGAV